MVIGVCLIGYLGYFEKHLLFVEPFLELVVATYDVTVDDDLWNAPNIWHRFQELLLGPSFAYFSLLELHAFLREQVFGHVAVWTHGFAPYNYFFCFIIHLFLSSNLYMKYIKTSYHIRL